jgi:hypothetical protein
VSRENHDRRAPPQSGPGVLDRRGAHALRVLPLRRGSSPAPSSALEPRHPR